MINIEMDAVVNEYVLSVLEGTTRGRSTTVQYRAAKTAFKTMIAAGLIRHRYDPRRRMEEFRATEALTQQWRKEFPEVADLVEPTEVIVMELDGNRSEFCWTPMWGALDRQSNGRRLSDIHAFLSISLKSEDPC
jgi:hypothetical protein